MVLLRIRKDWVETLETRVGRRVGDPINWRDPTKVYTHTLPYLPCPNANPTLNQRKPYSYHYQYAIWVDIMTSYRCD